MDPSSIINVSFSKSHILKSETLSLNLTQDSNLAPSRNDRQANDAQSHSGDEGGGTFAVYLLLWSKLNCRSTTAAPWAEIEMAPPSKLKDILAKFESNISGNKSQNHHISNPRQRNVVAPIKERDGAVVIEFDTPSASVKSPCIKESPDTRNICRSSAEPPRRPKVGFADSVMVPGPSQCNGGASGYDTRPDNSVKSLAAFFEMQSASRSHRQSLGSRSIQSAPEKSSRLYRKWSPPLDDKEIFSSGLSEQDIPLSVTSDHVQATYSKATSVVPRRAAYSPVRNEMKLVVRLTQPSASTSESDSNKNLVLATSQGTGLSTDPAQTSSLVKPTSSKRSTGKKTASPATSNVTAAAAAPSLSPEVRNATTFIKLSQSVVTSTVAAAETKNRSRHVQNVNISRSHETKIRASATQQIATQEIRPSRPTEVNLSVVDEPLHDVRERSALAAVPSRKATQTTKPLEVVVSLPECDALSKRTSKSSPEKKPTKSNGKVITVASATATAQNDSTRTSTSKAKKAKAKAKKTTATNIVDNPVPGTTLQHTALEGVAATSKKKKKKSATSPPVTKKKKKKVTNRPCCSKSKDAKSEVTNSSQGGMESGTDMDCHASFCMTESPLEYRLLGFASTSNLSHDTDDDDSTIMLEFDFEDDYSIGEASEFGRSFASSTADFLCHITERSGVEDNESSHRGAKGRGASVPCKIEPNNTSSSVTTRTDTESYSSFDGAYWQNDKAIVQFGEGSRRRSSIPGRR
jgi:hypothetical protein